MALGTINSPRLTFMESVMKKRKREFPAISTITVLLFGGMLSSNAPAQTPGKVDSRTISLGIVAETHQKEIAEHFHDFVGYLARKLSTASNVKGQVVVVSSLSELAKLLEQGKVDFYMESPYPTYVVNSVHGAAKLLLRRWQRGKPEYRSLIFTQRNSGINHLEELRGKIVVFEDPESTSGYLLPKFFLLRNGFKLSEKAGLEANVSPGEVGYFFARSQQKLVDMVLAKQAAAGAFSDDDHARLDGKRASDVSILAQTELLPRHLVSIRKDMAAASAGRLAEILVSMHEDDEGRRILQKIGDTTKFDELPEGEEGMRRRLLDTFYSAEKK
jgi:phosphonate transport system substrate-binding protein